MTYAYNIHDILKVESDIALLNEPFHRYFLVDEVSEPDISIKMYKDFDFPTNGLSRHDLWFYGKEGEDFVYYNDRIFGMKDKVLVKNLKGKTEIKATKSTLRVNLRSRGSLFDLVEAVIDLKLLKSGYSVLHAACLSKDGSAIVLTGFPNIGKTLSTLYLLKNGFKYLSDDDNLLDYKGNAYCYPTTSAIGYEDFVKFIGPESVGKGFYYRVLLKTWIMNKSKIIPRIFNWPKLFLPDSGYELTDKSKVNIVCSLEIGERKIKQIEPKELVPKILVMNDYSRPRIHQNPFMQVYAYFNDLSFAELYEKEREILLNILRNCRCYSLACNQRDWGSVLSEVLSRE